MSAALPVYLDYAATSPVDARVAAAMSECLTRDGVFGNPASLHKHGRLARESGVACLVSKPPSLLLDIDTDDDLRALASLPAGHAATRAALQDARWQS